MALTPEQLLALNDRIGDRLTRHLEPLFRLGVKLTFIARTPGNDEADVLVTSEGHDLSEVVALVLRSQARAVVGRPTDQKEGGNEASTGGGEIDLSEVPVPRENSWQRPSREWYAEKIAETQQAEDAVGGVLAAGGAVASDKEHQ